MREITAFCICLGGGMVWRRRPSTRTRTETASRPGSMWISLARPAMESLISESTYFTTGASSASLRSCSVSVTASSPPRAISSLRVVASSVALLCRSELIP